jgi:tetratricopeptide (TPR) repeat protein
MLRFWRRFTLFASCILAVSGVHAQSPSKAEVKPDYSKEAFIFENSVTHIVFENDGTGTRESFVRIRIQSDAGVQRYGLLTFAYQNSIESLDIDYVRVVKPDASIVVTPPENTQDITAEITRGAPFYSDLREKHVAVKGLSVGDTLEFKSHWTVTKPLAPGQFWYAYNFTHNDIMLHEQLQISIPRDRAVKWKSRDLQPVIAEEGARRVFTWTNSQLEHKSTEQEKTDQETVLYQGARGKLPPADVQISTFQSWEEVGRWYGSLQLERVKPTPEVRAKAAELTKGATDDDARLRAIYKYVSTQFHYIGIAFGIGRYQPHAAAEVLANQYGDCKDKETLFASLLDAAGIKAYPALISSAHELELDVPSPGQFDHVIGVVPQASGFLWFDTTTEVAPFAYLVKPLRDKQALVIQDGKPPTLVATPVDPPSKLSQTFIINAKLDDTGTLNGRIERTLQGDDAELLFRSAFRSMPMPQWKDLIQQISYGSGFSGDVSEVSASSPENTNEPFRLSYTYTRKDYPNWSSRQISSPLPPFLGVTTEKPANPIILGELGSIQYESHVELPKGYSAELPSQVDLKEDFAEYHGSYAVRYGMMTTNRRFVVKLREVPLSEYDTYKRFAKAVGDDHELYIALSSGDSSANPSDIAIRTLPSSKDSEAIRAETQALEAMKRYDSQTAIDMLKTSVKSDAKFVRAWVELGSLLIPSNLEAGLDALHSAIAIDSGPETLNAVAFSMVEADQDVAEALEYARRAVNEEEEASKKVDLTHLRIEDLHRTQRLAAYWDTLGWAYCRLGKLDEAEKYLKASWFLSQSSTVGDHLGRLYEEKGDRETAIHVYKLALGAASNAAGGRPVMPETQARLDKLVGTDPATLRDGIDLGGMRTVHLGRIVPDNASAVFFLIFAAGPKVEDVRFVSGSEKLKSAQGALMSAKFDLPFPDDGPTRIVRRGLLMCFPTTGCSFVLVPPSSVNSVD